MLKYILFVGVVFAMSLGHAQDHGVCYSSQSQSTLQNQGDFTSPALTEVPLSLRHWLALRASMQAYSLPDLDENLSGEQFVQRFEAFYSHPVPGYQHWYYTSDRTTGLKYIILEPVEPTDPWIFAFAGTQTTLDTFADLSMGRDQVQVIEDVVKSFLDCGTVDRQGRPLASHNWLITGHSLGGGMAQVFAYLTQSLRMLMRLEPNKVELVTFNGFGAMDVVLGGAPFAELVAPGILSYNYFVTSDPVSKIGTHVGNTYELPMAGAGGNPKEIFSRHSLSTIESLVVHGDSVDFSIAVPATPPYSGPLNALKGVGHWLGFLAENHADNLTEQVRQRNLLINAANVIIQRGQSGSLDHLTLAYLRESTLDLKKDLESFPQSSLRSELIQDLEALLKAIRY